MHALRDILGSLVECARFRKCLFILLLSYRHSRIRAFCSQPNGGLVVDEVVRRFPVMAFPNTLNYPLSTLAEPSTCPTFHFTFSRSHHVVTRRCYHLCIPLCGYAVVFYQRPHLHSFNEYLHHPPVLHQGQHHQKNRLD